MENEMNRTLELTGKFKALSHPCRLNIVQGLFEKESNVTALQQALGISQPSISAHLARLRAAGIIEGQRRGQEIHYQLIDEDTKTLLELMQKQET